MSSYYVYPTDVDAGVVSVFYVLIGLLHNFRSAAVAADGSVEAF